LPGISVAYVICVATLSKADDSSIWRPCTVRNGGPGSDRVAEAVGYYERAFGAGEHNIPRETTREVICNGLAFGVRNVAGYDQADTPENRQKAIDSAGDIGDGFGCVYDTKPKVAYSIDYTFTKESDSTKDCTFAGSGAACCTKGCNGEIFSGTGPGCE
jgi:hypothetical protein